MRGCPMLFGVCSAILFLASPLPSAHAIVTMTGCVPSNPGNWNSSCDGTVGIGSTGILQVNGGSLLSSQNGYIGCLSNLTGTVTVSDAGSMWTNSSSLYVGQYGNGTLTVTNGGVVTSATLYASTYDLLGNGTISTKGAVLGANMSFDAISGSQTTVAFGTGGTLTVNADGTGVLGAGYQGTGTLRIADGVAVASTDGYLGYYAGSGTATVTGARSKWISNKLYIGYGSSGTLSIEAGGQVSNTSGYVGYNSTGTATVTGAESKWISNNLYIGYGSSGTLNIEAGGQVSNTSGYVGVGHHSVSTPTGTATVTGTGSTWTNSGDLYVSDYADPTDAKLTVKDGAVVTAKTLYASPSNLYGNGTISTNGAVLDTNLIFDATHGSHQELAFGTGGTLNLNLDGTSTLGVGYTGIGTLRITDGVTVACSNGYLGYGYHSSGTATVTGTGSKWTNSDNLWLGCCHHSSGTLNIKAGGQVSSCCAYLGSDADSSGTVSVTGTGSKLTTSSDLYIGNYRSTGRLNVEAGGQISCRNGYVSVGSTGSAGTATVSGAGSMWTNSGYLEVGRYCSGTLNITAGGQVSSRYGLVGTAGGASTVTVTGPGSMWTNSDDLYVGNASNSTLNITDFGLVSVGGNLNITQALGYGVGGFVNMSTGGMLALHGDADDSIAEFLDLVEGYNPDRIRWWDDSINKWALLTAATRGADYTLQYQTAGDLAGYTLLTVGPVPEPNTFIMLLAAGAALFAHVWRKRMTTSTRPTFE